MKPHAANDDVKLAMADEGTRAQHWRQVIMQLSQKQLSELTGYSVTAIRCFEANANTSGELFGEAAWKRYRNACAGVLFVRAMSAFKAGFDWDRDETGVDHHASR